MYSRVGLSGVELKLGARCPYKQILSQALEILFLWLRPDALTSSPVLVRALTSSCVRAVLATVGSI
jgi:hypothetical protein